MPTPTFVQAKGGATVLSYTKALTFDDPTTSGNLVVVMLQWHSRTSTITGVADDAGNVYAAAGSPVVAATEPRSAQIWYAANITGKSGHVVTATCSGYPWIYMSIAEFSGCVASPADGFAGTAYDSLTAPFDCETGALTPTLENDLMVSCLHYGAGIDVDGFPSGATYWGSMGSAYDRCYYKVLSTTAAFNAQFSLDGNSSVIPVMALFRSQAGWIDIANFVEQEIPSSAFPSGVARVLGYLWSSDADAVLKARLYNVTDGASVGESAEISGDTPQACDFAVTLASGTKSYRLQVTSDTPDTDIFMSSRGVGP